MTKEASSPQVWPSLGARDARALITFHAYAVTGDPDALFARAVSNGAEVVRELTDQEYGSREFAERDPEGDYWSFGTYRGEPR